MKALSIRQPWAWLIVNGYKNIENRDWGLPKSMLDQRIYVHAGKRADRGFALPAERILCAASLPPSIQDIFWALWREEHEYAAWFGAIIGEVDIRGCVGQMKDNPWFVGPYGFLLRNPLAYERPIPYKGQLGFFEVKEDGLSAV